MTSAFLFAWIMGVVGNASAGLWGFLLALTQGNPAPEYGVQFLVSPVMAAIAPWIGAGLVHLGCLIFGANSRGFDATFRAWCYAQGPMVLGVVPFLGTFVASIWSLVLLVTGLSLMQRTTTGKAVGSVLLPILIPICLCLGAVAFLGAAFGMGALGALGMDP